MAIDYQTTGNAWDSREVREQPQESQLTFSGRLQDIFDEWLVPGTPDQASETLPWDTETFDPFQIPIQEENDGELPSGMQHPASDPYIPQFQVTGEGEDDLNAIFGHSEKD